MSEKYIKARRIVQGLSLENLNPSMVERLAASIQASALFPFHALGERLVYRKVREATGGRIKQMISGGGALPKHIDDFFEIIGVEILQGYGLTETSPVTHARRPWRNLRGSAGQAIPGTETKIVDPETRKTLSPGERGLVLLRGPQIMQGYDQNPEATAKAIDAEGWFDSGDLGWVTPQNDLVLTGRAKDTIVLTNGENIEPQPIEDACLRSPYIDQIMLVGQDQRSLGALIVPNLEALQKWLETQNLHLRLPNEANIGQSQDSTLKTEVDLESKIIQDLFRLELNREVQNRPGYRPDDRIGLIKLIVSPFSIENGMMTQTLKIRRHIVMERYRDIINGMFSWSSQLQTTLVNVKSFMDVSKPQLLLKRVVNVKAIVTSLWKEEVQQQLQAQINQLDQQLQQLDIQGQRAVAEIQKQSLQPPGPQTLQQIDNIQVQVNQKKSELLEQKNQSLQNLQQVQFLELDQQVNQFQMEGFFRVEPGDNLISKMQVEILLRDGVVEEIIGDI